MSRNISDRTISQMEPKSKRRKTEGSVPCFPALGESYFSRIPCKVFSTILHLLPLSDLGVFAMSSKAVGSIIRNEVLTPAFFNKLLHSLATCENGAQLGDQCNTVGWLLKRATCLIPVKCRLHLFWAVCEKILHEEPTIPGGAILSCVGCILSHFIAGWDDEEWLKVFNYVNRECGLSDSLTRFVNNGKDDEMDNEFSLRQHIRSLYLDHCACDQDKAIWLSFISNRINDASKFAHILLLLYGPVNSTEDGIVWDFAVDMQSFRLYTGSYKCLGKVFGCLRLMPNWSPSDSLEVLVHMSNIPKCWLLRSFAALLLPLSCIDHEVVVNYFKILLNNNRGSTAAMLLALVMTVSREFVHDSQRAGTELIVDTSHVRACLVKLLNSPKLSVERPYLLRRFWVSVQGLASDFMETAVEEADVFGEAYNDFLDLVSAWMKLSAALTCP